MSISVSFSVPERREYMFGILRGVLSSCDLM